MIHTLAHLERQDLPVFSTLCEGNFWLSLSAILLKPSCLKALSPAAVWWDRRSRRSSSVSAVVHDVRAIKRVFALPSSLLLALKGSTAPLIDRSDLSDERDPVDLFEALPATRHCWVVPHALIPKRSQQLPITIFRPIRTSWLIVVIRLITAL